jgi:2-dehydropantoate 2-reductase
MSLTSLAIVGVGALGCLFGSLLSSRAEESGASAGRAPATQVWLLGSRSEHLERVQQHGVTVVHLDGRRRRYHVAATADPAQIPMADVVLILVKSPQTQRAARQAARLLKPTGTAISLQNGLGNLDILAEVCGERRVTAGVTLQGAYLLEPGEVRHAGSGPTSVGVIPARKRQLREVVGFLCASGLETVLVEDVDSLLWGKLAVNAAINPLTALLDIPNGQLLASAERRRLVAAAAREVARLAEAQGIALPYADAAEQAFQVCRATAANRSSMLQDIQRGVPTEIDAMCGAVVRLGRQLGLATPVNAALYQLVKAKESGQVEEPHRWLHTVQPGGPNRVCQLKD